MSCVTRSSSSSYAPSAGPSPDHFRRRAPRTVSSSSQSASSEDGDEHSVAGSQERTALDSFKSRIDEAELGLRALKRSFRQMRERSDQLLELHPNDLSTHTAALPLRDALTSSCATFTSLDGLLQSLWREDQALRTLARSEDETRRQELLDDAIDRFLRRLAEIKTESRFERQERREADDRVRPRGLEKYLVTPSERVEALWRTEAIPAARYVVENPFTVLGRMDEFRRMGLAAMVKSADYWDADNDRTTVPPTKRSKTQSAPAAALKLLPTSASTRLSSIWKGLELALEGVADELGFHWDTKGSELPFDRRWLVILLLCLLSAALTALFVVRSLRK